MITLASQMLLRGGLALLKYPKILPIGETMVLSCCFSYFESGKVSRFPSKLRSSEVQFKIESKLFPSPQGLVFKPAGAIIASKSGNP